MVGVLRARPSAMITGPRRALLDGFTPYAKDVIYNPNWTLKDNSIQVFVLGGRDKEAHRLRETIRDRYSTVWSHYSQTSKFTHLWVVRNGRRHLVHAKGRKF
jgi:hypothetical protein